MRDQFNEIIKSKDLKDISIDLIEKVFDNEITNDVLREIPILKSIVAVQKIYTSYSDKIFIKKAMNVLLELSETNWKERVELTAELDDEHESGATVNANDFLCCKQYTCFDFIYEGIVFVVMVIYKLIQRSV